VRAATTIIDDFEDSDLSEYDPDPDYPGQGSIVSSPTYNGSYALAISDENTELISTSGLDNYPGAGDTFSFWVRASGGADNLNVSWGVQGHDDRYYAKLKPLSGEFHLFKYKSESGDYRDGDTSLSLSQDTWYEIEIDWGSGGTQTATLYNSSGSQLAQLSMSDSEWSTGGVGYDGYLGSGESVYFDYVTLEGSGTSSSSPTLTIDDFEDGDKSEYNFDRGSSSASIVSSPTYSQSYALEYSDTNIEAISTSGINAYPSAGDTFSFWVRASGGANNLNVTWGVQDHANRYYAKLYPSDGSFYLFTYKDGSGSSQDGDSGLSLSQDTWYEIEIDWATDGTQTATLYDSDESQLSQISMTDSTWTSGSVGYDAYLSSGESVYFDHVNVSSPRVLGTFEAGLDGWATDGNHQLTRVSESDQPGGVTEGRYCLQVQTDSSTPQIENESRFSKSDPSSTPYLIGDVIGTFENSSADLNLRIKYHRSDGGSTEESPTIRLPEWEPGYITWDMTGLPAEALDNPGRLELIWYPSDQPPGSSFDYTGQLFLDNVRLTDRAHQCSTCGMKTKMGTYKTMFGHVTETVVDDETDTAEDGRFRYADGTEKDYYYEKVGDNKYKVTIDGETFKRGGGW
jgi:hypothetical protein